MAVAVEVAGSDHLPVRSGLATTALSATLAPFISQIATAPFVFCNRMSEWPSSLKSPVPMACQFGPGLATTALLVTLVPLVSQMAMAPLVFCNRTSGSLSSLKSPVPTSSNSAPDWRQAARCWSAWPRSHPDRRLPADVLVTGWRGILAAEDGVGGQ